MTDRKEIIDYALKSGLLRRCVECQVSKAKTEKQFLDDIEQDLWVWIMDYDIEKLSDAYENNHLNALISRVIINWLWSTTSPYHKQYRHFLENSDEITDEILNIPDGK